MARQIRTCLANLREAEELVQIGAYTPGADPALDQALQRKPLLNRFLRQAANDPCSPGETVEQMTQLIRS